MFLLVLFHLVAAHARPPAASLPALVEAWGQLAFQHPSVTSGRVPWDHALLAALAADNEAEAWAVLTASLSETDDPTVVLARLADMPYEPPPERDGGAHPWVHLRGYQPSWHPPTISDALMPEEGLRVLAVARAYAVLRWAYPYPDEEALRARLPRSVQAAVDATTPAEYHASLHLLASALRDGHLAVEAPGRAPPEHATPFALRSRVDGPPWVLRVAADAPRGVRAGDILLEVDGEPWADLAARLAPHPMGGTLVSRLEDRDQRVLNALDGVHRLTVQGRFCRKTVEVALGRRSVFPRPHPLPSRAFWRDDDVVVIDLQQLEDDALGDAMGMAENAEGLLIDLRGYPPYLPQQLASCLSSEEHPAHQLSHLALHRPGRFVTTVRSFGGAHCPGPRFDGPVAVLIDRITYSRGEFMAQVLASVPRVVLIGEPTAGTDGDRVGLPLPGRVTLMHSGLGVAWPDGRPTQGVGVVPELAQPVTRQGVRRGRDEPMEAALRWLREEHGRSSTPSR